MPRALFLWHLHQPEYRDPQSGQPLLPWVRLHATRAYTDMAAALERFPKVKAVVNWAPSLLLQLEAYVAGSAVDLDEELARRPTSSLLPAERAHVLKESFSVDWDLWVKPLAHYHELLVRRGLELKALDLSQVQEAFSDQDLLDLQVYFMLAWMGFTARREEPFVAELLAKERGFSEGDKRKLLDLQRRIAASVVPRWLRLVERGQVEICASPLYHPILPLLIDSDSARRAMPQVQLPLRFAWPDDARLQVERGLSVVEKAFGVRPVGMWPSEGSVSPEVMELFARTRVQWCATDADNLRKSEREGSFAEPLHTRPWRAGRPAEPVTVFFRDRELSDRLGFRYARLPAEQAAQDLLSRLAAVKEAEGGAVMALALDGENPWEHYPRSGEAFLEALYAGLSSESCPVQTVLPREELVRSPATRAITRLHSGSWIESNFRIWIGHPEDNEAWTQLALARAALAEEEQRQVLPRDVLSRAKETLLPAEGSDWFWWYGDDFQTENAVEFDALFRRRIAATFQILQRPVPERVTRPIIAAYKNRASTRDLVTEPSRLIHPAIDGFARGFFEWQGAGLWRPGHLLGGSMHQGQCVLQMLYGFSPDEFYLRIDPDPQGPQTPDALFVVLLRKNRPLQAETSEVEKTLRMRCIPAGPAEPVLDESGTVCGTGQSGAIVELSFRLAALDLRPADRLLLEVHLLRDGVELERIPRSSGLSLTVPDRAFEQANWQV